jgi:hypothetical protein
MRRNIGLAQHGIDEFLGHLLYVHLFSARYASVIALQGE